MEGREDTEKDSGDKETNKSRSPWMEEWDEERETVVERVYDERRKGYIMAAGLCVNVVSTLEAICCDNDKILTLERRKCSVSRTND